MKLEYAIEIVLELARGNIITEGDARDNGVETERNKAFDACNTLEDFAVNILAEERANFPEEEEGKLPCKHIDYASTLDGGRCNDCGIDLMSEEEK